MFVDKKIGKPHNAANALHVFWEGLSIIVYDGTVRYGDDNYVPVKLSLQTTIVSGTVWPQFAMLKF